MKTTKGDSGKGDGRKESENMKITLSSLMRIERFLVFATNIITALNPSLSLHLKSKKFVLFQFRSRGQGIS